MGDRYKITIELELEDAESEWKAVDKVWRLLRAIMNFKIVKLEKIKEA